MVELIAEENSSMTVIMDYASAQDAEGICSVQTRIRQKKMRSCGWFKSTGLEKDFCV